MDSDPNALQSLNTHRLAGRFRVAMVTETYPPEINGVAMTVARLVEGLVARGNEVQLIRPSQGQERSAGSSSRIEEVLTRGSPIPRYPELRIGWPAGCLLRRLWSKAPPDVVHIATEGPLGWSALQAARRLGLPVISDFRTNFDAYSRHYGVGLLKNGIKSYLRLFHNRTARTMVPTQALARELSAEGFRNLEVVARGVDTRMFNPKRRSEELRRSWGASSETLVVASIGRLAPEKNLGVLESACEAIGIVSPGTRFIVVGDGPAREELQRRCPSILFVGRRFGTDLAEHYASADLLLFPSVTETYGNVTPEAMASGLAVVAYDYAAASQLIRQRESGWLAPFDDTGAFLLLAAEAAADVSTVRRIGARARAVVSEMDWERIVIQIEGHYRAVRRWVLNFQQEKVLGPVLAR